MDWAISDTLYKSDFYQEFYLSHISSHAFIPLLICSLLQCCIELTVLWVSARVTACNSKVHLAYGKPVLRGWARLVVPVGFRCPGGLLGVLRLHVPRVRVAREHAHLSLAMQSRSIGMCRWGCPIPIGWWIVPSQYLVYVYVFALYLFAPIVVY